MKTKNQNNAERIEKILQRYFSRDEITEFSEKIVLQIIDDKKEKTDINFDDIQFRSLLDLLITYAKLKLEDSKLIELLLESGQLTITSGEFDLAIDIHKEILQLTRYDTNYNDIAANTLIALGEIYSRQAHWKQSFIYLKKAAKMFLTQKNYYGCARCENIIGTIYGDLGDLSKSKYHFEKSLEYLNEHPDSSLKASVEVNLGILNTIDSHYDVALNYFNRSLTFYEKTSDNKRLAEIRHSIGMIYLKKNDFKSAQKEFDQCIEFAVATGYLQILEIGYLSKAFLLTKTKEYIYAEKFANNALKISCRINDRLSIADIYKIKGIIHRQLENFSLSESYFLTSLRLNKELQNKLNEAETNFELAVLYQETRRVNESKVHFSSALKYYKKINAADEIKTIQSYLS